MEILQILINGLLLGSVYALIGIGMTMILGIVGLTNLSHGEFVVLGAYASTLIVGMLGIDPVLTLVITVPFMFLLGYFLQFFLINHAMLRGSEPALLVTFSVSIILQDAMLLLFSADARHTPTRYGTHILHFYGLNISVLNLVLFGISMACVAVLTLFLRYTYMGRAIRAVSDDREVAMLSGIRVDKVYAVAMAIALSTAAVAGLCVGMKWTFYPTSGGSFLLIAFIVVVTGGMESTLGTLFAGFGFGFAQVIGGANYGLLISYAVMLLVLFITQRSRKEW